MDDCDKTKLKDFKENQLCHVRTDSKGEFKFPCVSPGKYKLIPFLQGQNIHFQPDALDLEIQHNSLTLSEPFEVKKKHNPLTDLSFIKKISGGRF